MPSQPMATWITPCTSRKEYPAGTSSRRQTIGLIVSSHTFNCRSALAPSIGDGAARLGRSRLEVTKPDYRPHITFRHEAPHGSLCSYTCPLDADRSCDRW